MDQQVPLATSEHQASFVQCYVTQGIAIESNAPFLCCHPDWPQLMVYPSMAPWSSDNVTLPLLITPPQKKNTGV